MRWLLLAAVAGAVVWVGTLAWRWLAEGDARRAAATASEELADAKTAEAVATPGFVPDDPLRVSSAAAIEPRAQAIPCPVCEGPLHVQEHEMARGLGDRVRELQMKCGTCGTRQRLFAVVEAPLLN